MAKQKKQAYWLVKQEPSSYTWQEFLDDKKTLWDGVRNFQARNNLRAMKKGDQVLFYRSVVNPAVVGVSEVVREAYPDPTADAGDWSAVDLKAGKTLAKEVPLPIIKADAQLAEIPLLKQSRLSVMPLPAAAFKRIVALGSDK